jgi:hypothetical protein
MKQLYSHWNKSYLSANVLQPNSSSEAFEGVGAVVWSSVFKDSSEFSEFAREYRFQITGSKLRVRGFQCFNLFSERTKGFINNLKISGSAAGGS